jgi:hypothetical protein
VKAARELGALRLHLAGGRLASSNRNARSGGSPMRKWNEKLESGRAGWILLWALGVPIPILLVLYVLRGCT